MRTVNQVKRVAKKIISSAPYHVERVTDDLIAADIDWDPIDGACDHEKAALCELGDLEGMAKAMGYKTQRLEAELGSGLLIDSYDCLAAQGVESD